MNTKNLLFLVLLWLPLISFGQRENLTLTFSGSYYGQSISLDSVFVENLSEQCDTLLQYPDTILILDYMVAISQHETSSGQKLSQNYPNPFTNRTRFEIDLPHKDIVMLTVYSIEGKKLSAKQWMLQAGKTEFEFTSGSRYTYIVEARSAGFSQSIKMISLHKVNGSAFSLRKVGQLEESYKIESVISQGFHFQLNDSLRITAYATSPDFNTCTDVIIDTPDQSTQYDFHLTEGLPCPGYPVIYYYGTYYHTVQVGEQCWFKDNLNLGTPIPGSQNMKLNGVIEKYCYDDDTANCTVYGGLYQWRELMQYDHSEGSQGLCPPNWHVPTENDWFDLADLLGGLESAGGEMKEPGTQHWMEPNTGATNSSGFTALPSGKNTSGIFNGLGKNTIFQSSKSPDPDTVVGFKLIYDATEFQQHYSPRTHGLPARCIKDD